MDLLGSLNTIGFDGNLSDTVMFCEIHPISNVRLCNNQQESLSWRIICLFIVGAESA